MKPLSISNASVAFLDGLPAKQIRQVVHAVLSLLKNQQPHDSVQMKGYPYRRIDVGEYRIIYQVMGDTVVVELIGKRNDDDVYKKLGRRS